MARLRSELMIKLELIQSNVKTIPVELEIPAVTHTHTHAQLPQHSGMVRSRTATQPDQW